jgi:transcriptional regulator with XRE-family HTH domain
MQKMRAVTERDEIHNLAVNLALSMRKKDWTQKDLEGASGITQATISNILREKYDPAVSIVSRLAKALRTSIDTLLSPPPQKKLRNAS